ncbi:hypothetical protein [Pectobacterium polaris]|uniref:hypothetical protein n=1 Tax=Pectobacterium polaris TaxID=2042057 RepID=UPI0020C62BB0|nr:hypothetical protein [Pectobacterium polaris]
MNNSGSVLKDILVLGAGQLGMAVLRALAPRARALELSVTALISPDTINDPLVQDRAKLAELRALQKGAKKNHKKQHTCVECSYQ